MWTYPRVRNAPPWFQLVLVIAYLAIMALSLKGISYIWAQKWLAAVACFVGVTAIAVTLIVMVRKF